MKSVYVLGIGITLIVVGLAAFIYFFPRFDRGPGKGLPSGIPQWLALPMGIVAAVSKEVNGFRFELFDRSNVRFESSLDFDVQKEKGADDQTEAFKVHALRADEEDMGIMTFVFIHQGSPAMAGSNIPNLDAIETHHLDSGRSIRIRQESDPTARSWEARPDVTHWLFTLETDFPGKVWGRVYASKAKLSELISYIDRAFATASWKGKTMEKKTQQIEKSETDKKRVRPSMANLLYVLDPKQNLYSAFIVELKNILQSKTRAQFQVLSTLRTLDGPNQELQAKIDGSLLELDLNLDEVESLRGAEGKLLFITTLRNHLRHFAIFSRELKKADLEVLLKDSSVIVGIIQDKQIDVQFSFSEMPKVQPISFEPDEPAKGLGVFLVKRQNDKVILSNKSAFGMFDIPQGTLEVLPKSE